MAGQDQPEVSGQSINRPAVNRPAMPAAIPQQLLQQWTQAGTATHQATGSSLPAVNGQLGHAGQGGQPAMGFPPLGPAGAAGDGTTPAVLSTFQVPANTEPGPTQIWMKDRQGEWVATVLIRKVVKIDAPISGSLQVYPSGAAFEIFCNGRQVGSSEEGEPGGYFDLTQSLRRGDNVIALQARRTGSETPSVGIRLRYHTSLTRQTVETDGTWLVAQKALPLWRSPMYNDRTWQEASVVTTEPRSAETLPVPFALANSRAAQAPTSNLPTSNLPTSNLPTSNLKAANRSLPPGSLPPGSLPGQQRSATPGGPRTGASNASAAASNPFLPDGSGVTLSLSDLGPDRGRPVPVTPPPVGGPATSGMSREAAGATQKIATTDEVPSDHLKTVQVAGPGTAGGNPAETSVSPIHFSEMTANENAQEAVAGPTSAGSGGPSTEGEAQTRGDEIELRVPESFAVEAVASAQIGSLIKIEFDEFGRILASREAGGLIRIDLSLPVDHPSRVSEVCDSISAIQGILPLNGQVYVTGVGPGGLGLYRLSDGNGDAKFDVIDKLCGFSGQPGEHGPHAIQLGTDRMLYVLLGNHSQLEGPAAETSPLRDFYEGDLLPRYEDPSGHAAGVKAPGGTLIRMSLDGQQREIVAGGLRNAYGFAFNQQGDVLLHDSDMESDEGTPWYRPTRLYHVFAGADFGWRSGWAKWPEHYLDAAKPVARTGRGSPSGAAVYDHVQFPKAYHNALFTADWAIGRIMVVRLQPAGASYQAQLETFMEGRPLNVTDIAIGPQDGALYVALGGRQSSGGIYRVRWTGEVPPALTTYANPWEEVIRAPMFYSAATRQRIAILKQQVTGWDETLKSVAMNAKNVDAYRTRALDIMQWFGPVPTVEWLTELSKTESAAVRSKAAAILGTRGEPAASEALQALLTDPEAWVQRVAGESLLRSPHPIDPPMLIPVLKSSDPTVATIGRRLLGRQDFALWETWISQPQDPTLFRQAAVAALTVQPSLKLAYDCLVGVDQQLSTADSPETVLELLRITQLALGRGSVDPTQIPAFVEKIAAQFPATDPRVNRELAAILAYCKMTACEDRYLAHLQDTNIEPIERLHLALQIQTIGESLSLATRLELLKFLEQAKLQTGGGSYQHYLMQACRDIAKTLPPEQAVAMLEQGRELPNAALMCLAHLPKPIDADLLQKIFALEQQLSEQQDPSSKDLKIGLLAVLGEAIGDPGHPRRGEIAEHLIDVWKQDPNRRSFAAVAMAQSVLASASESLSPAPAAADRGSQTTAAGSTTAADAATTPATPLTPAVPGPGGLTPAAIAAETGDRPRGTVGTDVAGMDSPTGARGEIAATLTGQGIGPATAEPASVAFDADVFWTYYLRSLPQLNSFAAEDVFRCFLRLERTSQNPDHLRQVILLGLRHPSLAPLAIQVLEKWSQLPPEGRPGNSLVAWQSWYASRFPSELPATLPSPNESSKWSIEEIQRQLQLLTGDRTRGQQVYQQASCANCHVYQGQGQGGIGPDLNGLAQRFSQREIIESTIHPSLVISDRYRSEMLQLDDGRVLSGIVTPLSGGQVAVVDSQAIRTEVSKIDIVEIRKSTTSIMPSGLLDPLDAQQVVDLLTYLLEEQRERTAANQ
jgi:putative heme-binding domain-containing protein